MLLKIQKKNDSFSRRFWNLTKLIWFSYPSPPLSEIGYGEKGQESLSVVHGNITGVPGVLREFHEQWNGR